MFRVEKSLIIEKNSKRYLSFPDIIKDPNEDNKFFLVYREGNSHHPTWSKLILKVSYDSGETWNTQHEFPLRIKKNDYVWNCPRLSYIDNKLYVTCDQKSGIFERRAHFKIVNLISEKGYFFKTHETEMPGMVPDKIIEFKDKFVCANHRIKDINNNLIQLISWSRDRGKTWYDTNIMADHSITQFCEASVVNMGDYLIAYLRDNSGHSRNIYTVTSTDGIHWTTPNRISILGQRVTAIREGNIVIGSYRNTCRISEEIDDIKCKMSIFEHNIDSNEIKVSHIDSEYLENQYHFGYSGITKVKNNQYLVTYYIKQDETNPFIKLAFIERN